MARPRDDRQKDLLRPALDQIIDMGHPLVRLAERIDWEFLNGRFGSVCQPGPGQPGLPTRLVAGLFILKHGHRVNGRLGEVRRTCLDLILPSSRKQHVKRHALECAHHEWKRAHHFDKGADHGSAFSHREWHPESPLLCGRFAGCSAMSLPPMQ
jgi:hypothetical protein